MADRAPKADAAAPSAAAAAASVPPIATGTAAASTAAAAAAAASSTTGGAAAAAAAASVADAGVGAAAKSKPGSTKPGGGKKQQQAPPLTAEQSARLAARAAADAAKAEAKRAEADLPHQTMLHARRADVRGRLDGLVSSLASLQSTLTQSETDSTDVLKYLEGEVRRKDIHTKQLAKQIREMHAQQVAQRARKQEEYAAEIQALEQVFAQKEQQLLELNRLRHQEHSDLGLFARMRPELLHELSQTKRVILKNTQRHRLQMTDLEHKFLAARTRLMEESTARIAEARRAYKEEVGRELDLESQWITTENQSMQQELSFHQSLIAKLEAENQQLQSVVAQLESSVHTMEKRDTSYATAALRETKTMQEMQKKAAMIQASIQQIRTGDSTAASASSAAASSAVTVASDDDASLWSLQTELQKLQGLSALKVRESSSIRSQLGQLQSQTNDVMQLAIEALATVKIEICTRRKTQYQRDVALYRQSLAELAKGMYQPQGRKAIGAGSGSAGSSGGGGGIEIQSDPRCPPPLEPQLDPRRLTLADFGVADRERVLQLIFEALNRSTGVTGEDAQTDAQQTKEDTRPSSAVSLYTGGSVGASRSGSATSLVLSRPASSLRGSRPASSVSTRGSRPASSTNPRAASGARTRPSPPSQPPALAAVDMRPSEYERLAGLAAAAGGRAQKAQQLKPARSSRHGDEKETAFFPPRGDTPTELL